MRPIYLLVVAAAYAWDFPWSSTEEGWAPAEDTRPEEDPFWVDHAPCEADTRPPRNEKRGRALMPRTVNGTGHTGPSEFCATSI